MVISNAQDAVISAELRAPRRASWLHWKLLSLVAVMAMLGAIGDSWAPVQHSSWLNLHPWFALVVLGWVISQFYLRRCDGAHLVRPLSRSVYLLLYVTIFTREALQFAGVAWHQGSIDLALLHSYLGLPLDQATAGSGSDLRGYVACGILALVLLRALAAVAGRAVRLEGLLPR